MKRLLLSGLLLLATGCSTNTTFVYKPSATKVIGRKLPVQLAVLPFEDGTEEFTTRGSILAEDVRYNLARAGISHRITALTPALWAKAFADEIEASGKFRGIRFLYDTSELTGEEYRIEGTVEKAFASGYQGKPNEFSVRFRAIRRSDGQKVWERVSSRIWVQDEEMYGRCSVFDQQCATDLGHGDFNRVMREIFAEALADLVRTLEPLLGSRRGTDDSIPAAAAAPTQLLESVDETIENILRGQ